MAFGTGSSVRPNFSRQTLVFQRRPSTVATTGVRPQAKRAGGALSSGTGAKVQPPLPGMRKSVVVNSVIVDRACGT